MSGAHDSRELERRDVALRPPGLPQVPWGVPEGIGAFAGCVLLQLVVGALFGVEPDDLAVQMKATAASDVAVLILIYVLVRVWSGARQSPAGLLGLRRTDWRTVARAWRVVAAGAAAYVAVVLVIGSVLYYFGSDWEVPAQPLVRLIARTESAALVAFSCLVAMVVVPVMEEVLFRSVLYLPLRDRLGVIPAALIISALFAAVHAYPWGTANLIVLSLTFVALFERTGTLWAPIAAHGLYNGLMILLVRADLVPLPG
ncbi:MAG: CPBP family intramembrane metalloprotease [Candidatus Brocadiae bacterium]|nr:CPBP family intramembrane metalloprotease [Candidatus Brocadiia bacterium]